MITDFPLADILHNQDATGRISKWAVELGALSIDFKPCTAIKSQALVNFMAEWRENQTPTPIDKPEHWTCTSMGLLSSTAAALESYLFPHGANNRSTFSRSFGRYHIMKPSMKLCFTGYVWRYHWASSDYLYMAIHFLWFSKSTMSGTATRRRWTLMYKKCASWKTSFLVWRFIMCYGSIMLAQIYYRSWGLLVHRFQRESLSRS
jgi:hypothetical protein